MTRASDPKWSQQITEHSDAPDLKHAVGAQPPKEDKSRLEKAKDALRSLYHRPLSGRSTAVGRRVEKPGSGSPAGPSGQKDGAKHDGKHTNK